MDASIRFRVNAIGQVLGMRKKNRSRINIDDCRAHHTHHRERETLMCLVNNFRLFSGA